MPIYFANNKIVYFAQIPETDDGTVQQALIDAGAREALNSPSRFKKSMSCTAQHWHSEIHEFLVPPSFYDFGFAITRHPFDRLQSEFHSLTAGGRSKITVFDTFVKKWMRVAKKRDPYCWNNHFRPQYEFILPSIEVFKIEDGFDAPINRAFAELGIEAVVSLDSIEVPKTESEPLEWSDEALAMATNFYQRDFEQFNYDPEDVNITINNSIESEKRAPRENKNKDKNKENKKKNNDDDGDDDE